MAEVFAFDDVFAAAAAAVVDNENNLHQDFFAFFEWEFEATASDVNDE